MSFVKAQNSNSNSSSEKKSKPMTIVGKVIGYEQAEDGKTAVRVEVLNENKMYGKQALITLKDGEFGSRPDISAFDPATRKKGKIGKIPEGGIVSFDGTEFNGKGDSPYILASRWMNNMNFNPELKEVFITGGLRDDKHNLTVHAIREDGSFVAPKNEALNRLAEDVLSGINNHRNPSAILVAVNAAGEATAGFTMSGVRSKDANGEWIAPKTVEDISGKDGVVATALGKQSEETLKAFLDAASIMVVMADKLPVTFQSKVTVSNLDRIARGLNGKGDLNATKIMVSLSDPSGDNETVYVNKAASVSAKFDPVAVIGARLGVKVPGADGEAGAGSSVVAAAESTPDESHVAVTNELDELDSAFNENVESKAKQTIGF